MNLRILSDLMFLCHFTFKNTNKSSFQNSYIFERVKERDREEETSSSCWNSVAGPVQRQVLQAPPKCPTRVQGPFVLSSASFPGTPTKSWI